MREPFGGKRLTELQADALREAGNIGAGNATVALSQMVNKVVGLSTPKATLMRLVNIPELVGGAESPVAGVYLNVAGDCSGSILLLLEESSAETLARLMLPGAQATPTMTVLMKSCLQETGSILAAAYLNALSQFTGLRLMPNVPGFALDMAGAVLDFVLVDLGASEDHVLVVETDFDIEGDKVNGHLILFPDFGALTRILDCLGVPFE